MSDTLVRTFGGFSVWRNDDALHLPLDVERLVAFLCVCGGQMPRPYVAGVLWPHGTDKRALGNLRSALWRLRKQHPDVITADSHSVRLAANVSCDITDVLTRASQLSENAVVDLREHAAPIDVTQPDPCELDLDLLSHRPFADQFLPGWYDEWVLVERERMRQLCLHALEDIAGRHASRGRFGAAIQALLASISLDDLRESPRRQLISIHLAEGNPTEAIRQYDDYASTLDIALGLAPSPAMSDLLASVRRSGRSQSSRSLRPSTFLERSRDALPTGNNA